MLEEFLNAKPLYYEKIDYNRMPRVYNRIKEHFSLNRIIHIIGTNGKGTTGRFLSTALYKIGFDTGHYSSPHILQFNERIWFNGRDVSMESLEETHQKLLAILTQEEAEALSYFEYTTLLAMLYFSNRSEFVILEAGLGGEHDATAVFDNLLTVVTPIDRDHEAFLGEDISAIATTKLNAIKKDAIVAKQKYQEVYACLQKVSEKKKVDIYFCKELLDEQDFAKIEHIAKEEKLADYLIKNLALAVSVLNFLKINYKEEHFYNAKLFGRLTFLQKNIIVDVGHNVLAAHAIAKSLKEKKYVLVYNSYRDKDYKEILSVLKPVVSRVEIIDFYNSRLIAKRELQQSLQELDIECCTFKGVNSKEEYLVFGSFSVVEAFLKVWRG